MNFGNPVSCVLIDERRSHYQQTYMLAASLTGQRTHQVYVPLSAADRRKGERRVKIKGSGLFGRRMTPIKTTTWDRRKENRRDSSTNRRKAK